MSAATTAASLRSGPGTSISPVPELSSLTDMRLRPKPASRERVIAGYQLATRSALPDFEGQQNIAWKTAPLSVSGIYVEHAIDDGWAGSVHGAATGRNTIHRGIVSRRVHL